MQMSSYKCSKCNYITNRRYNLDRHISMRHQATEPEPVSSCVPDPLKKFECDKCHRTFTRRCYLGVHQEKCEGVPKGCCKICKQYCATKDILYKHKLKCMALLSNNIQKQVNDA